MYHPRGGGNGLPHEGRARRTASQFELFSLKREGGPAMSGNAISPAMVGGFAVFSMVMSFSPGPNNVLLATSGAHYGLRRSAPLILGITFGVTLMLLLVGLGLSALIKGASWLQEVMRLLSAAYLAWIAWGLANARSLATPSSARPMSFVHAAAFQWINPKAWVIAIAAIASYTTPTGPSILQQIGLLTFIHMAIAVTSCLTWAAGGLVISRLLTTERRRKLFNYTMAGLLLASIVPVLSTHNL